MFDRIAGRYDAMNSVMTAGMHHRWRQRAADRAGLAPGNAALDVCCGTGDLALELASRVSPDGSVIGCDFSEPMLDLAREKANGQGAGGVRFEWADALQLPYDDGRFDAVTVGFGVRNLADLDRGLREMTRVLRPGGRLVILEITQPTRPPLSTFYSLWFDRLVPVLGTFAGDTDAYSYLPESVRGFPNPLRLAEMMECRRSGEHPLHGAGRRDHRDPQRRPGVTRRPSAVPPPVTAVLDASSRWLPARLGEVEELLREQSTGHGETLAADAAATLAAGGKRLRPLLVLLCAGPDGGEAAVRAAAAIELVHMATLVHDDVLDEAPLRRGQPTIAATSGRERAVAVGDLLFSRAFALLAEAGDERAVVLLAEASTALARGELAQRQDAFDIAISEDRYFERCRLKTAALFECACLLGRDEEAMRSFGRGVGLAFQLLDDVLDVSGPPERTGKARGTDLLDGTVTLPLIEALKLDPELKLDLRSIDAKTAEELCDRIAATGALELVRTQALELVTDAKAQLRSPAFNEEQCRLLNLVADGVVSRYT